LAALNRSKHPSVLVFVYALPMINWFEQLRCAIQSEAAVVMVTVIAVRGSAPREVGARLLISDARQWGTVGGGNLEYKASALARELLKSGQQTEPETECFALGPSLGQCCGGHVELMFEYVDRDTDWFRHAVKLTNGSSERYWICRSLSVQSDYQVVKDATIRGASFPGAQHLAGRATHMCVDDSALPFISGISKSVDSVDCVVEQQPARGWCELLEPTLPEVWVFGAGHVGHALHEQLQLLPCHSVAIDSRDEFLQQLSPSVQVISTDNCAAEVMSAPAGVWFIVMTHSHAIDFDICNAVLKRTDFAYLGLIGSATKRATFASRLEHRGIDVSQVGRLISPIGLTAIRSRVPQLIALGVAADLAQQWHGTTVDENSSKTSPAKPARQSKINR